MMNFHKGRRPWAGALLVVALVVGCWNIVGAESSREIVLGEVDPLTGRLAKHGLEIHEGILFAVQEANLEDPFLAHPLKLVVRDDQSRPEVAVSQAQDLILRKRVVALVGGYVDSLVGPVSVLASSYSIPYVASASLQRRLTEKNSSGYFFRVSCLKGLVEPLCRFLTERVHPKHVAILHAATPGATELTMEVLHNLRREKMDVPLVEKFRPSLTDFTPFLLKLRRHKVDVLIAAGFFPNHLVLLRQIRQHRVPLALYLGPWGIAYPSFVRELGRMSERAVGMCAWNPNITVPGTEKFSRVWTLSFRKRFKKEPTTTTMHGYTSARAVIEAVQHVLKSGRTLTGPHLAEALRKIDLRLPMERLAFDAKGDPKYYRQVVVQIQRGAIVPIYPRERATAPWVSPLTPPF